MVSGYEVLESSNVLQLEVGLRARSVFEATNVLLVLGARLATHCSLAIAAAARERSRVGLAPAQLILTYEFGSMATSPHLDLAPCVSSGSFEKPFDLSELQVLAIECRRQNKTRGADGASV